ncbi:MAG: hypothetical protein ABIU84_13175 [Thermoanaerobaculia bacterium]
MFPPIWLPDIASRKGTAVASEARPGLRDQPRFWINLQVNQDLAKNRPTGKLNGKVKSLLKHAS